MDSVDSVVNYLRNLADYVADHGISGMQGKAKIDGIADRLAALAPAGVGEDGQRGFSTDRRMAAVEHMLAEGWKWIDGKWTARPDSVSEAAEETLIAAIWQVEHPGKTSMFPLKYLAESEKDRYRRIIAAVRSTPPDDDDDDNSDYSREHDRYAER